MKSRRVNKPLVINIIFADDRTVRQLNRRFLRKNRNTDVIAFSYDSQPANKFESSEGDVYISVPEAIRNAKIYGEPLKREILRLVIHGLLHLAGISDKTPRQKRRMWKKQESFVKLAGAIGKE